MSESKPRTALDLACAYRAFCASNARVPMSGADLAAAKTLEAALAGIPVDAAKQIARLKDALAWYANPDNHETYLVDADSRGMHSPIQSDEGARAREALE